MMTVIYSFWGTLIFTAVLLYFIKIYQTKNIHKSATLDIEEILAEINRGILLLLWNTRPRERIFFHSLWGMEKPCLPRKILFIGDNCKHLLPFVFKNLPAIYFEKNHKRILYVDLAKCKVDKNYNFLSQILRKLGLFKPFEEFINTIVKALKIQNSSYENKPNSEILDLIVSEINKKSIIVVFNNSQVKANSDIITFISDIIERVKDVVILTEPVINPEILIDYQNVRKFQLIPNIYFDSTIFYANQHDVFEFQNQRYNGRDNIIFKELNSPMYLFARLNEATRSFYKNLFKFFGGNEYYLERTEGIEYFVNQYKDLLHDEMLLKKYYKDFFEKRIKNLHPKVFDLLLFIGIAPFSVHYYDAMAYCKSVNIGFAESIKILEEYMLVYKTNPSYYINISIEFSLFEKEYPEKNYIYFANGRNDDDLPYYLNCDNAKPLVRSLINEALIQRFHKDYGYYVTNPLRRIIRYLVREHDSYKQIVNWACEHYNKLRFINDSPSVELAYTFFNNEKNNFSEKEINIEVSLEKLKSLCFKETIAPNENFSYYSILLNQKKPIILTNKVFMHNLLFCYNHIMNQPCILYNYYLEEEDIVKDPWNEKNDEYNGTEHNRVDGPGIE